MTAAIVKHIDNTPAQLTRGLRIDSMNDLARFGEMLARSGFFRDSRDAVQACVKVQAGLELGVPPVQAMTGIHIVEGKPTLSAALIASLVKRSGKYNYRVTAHDDTLCTIVFYEGKEQVGVSTFSFADAERAGVTKNPTWNKYRRNMLWARAMSNGARWYTPDVFGGAVYTPEEMGIPVNEEGEAIAIPVVRAANESTPPSPAPYKADDKRRARVNELLAVLEITEGQRAYIEEVCGGAMPSSDDHMDALISELESRAEEYLRAKKTAETDGA